MTHEEYYLIFKQNKQNINTDQVQFSIANVVNIDFIDNKKQKEIFKYFCTYNHIEKVYLSNNYQYTGLPLKSDGFDISKFPEWYFSFEQMIKLFKSIVTDYEKSFRLEIKSEFFNIKTKNTGYFLKNGLIIENDNIIDNEMFHKVKMEYNARIDSIIEYFINPKERLRISRCEKLKTLED